MLDYLENMKKEINHENNMNFIASISVVPHPNDGTNREMSLFYPDKMGHIERVIVNKK